MIPWRVRAWPHACDDVWESGTRKLRSAGFENVVVQSVRDFVYRPFARYARERLDEPAVARRLHPLIRALWKASVMEALDTAERLVGLSLAQREGDEGAIKLHDCSWTTSAPNMRTKRL